MVGIGTAQVDLTNKTDDYCSFLGLSSESWGYSYTGVFYHKRKGTLYGSQFGKGSIIGLHLDTWHGTLSLYKNHGFIGMLVTFLDQIDNTSRVELSRSKLVNTSRYR